MDVAYSGCSVVMDFHLHVIKDSSEFYTRNCGQSATQTVSSGHYSCTRVFVEKILDFIVNSCCHCGIIGKEACMYFTSKAVDIGHFFEIEVFDPILYVLRASEGDDDGFSRGGVTDIPWGLSEVENDVADIGQGIMCAGFARPIFKTGPGAVCD